MNSDQIDLKTLRSEVEAVAKARSRERIDLAGLPVLANLADEPTVDSVLDLIEKGCSALEGSNQAAAAKLLADSPERWDKTYSARASGAATALGVGSYHTARDRKTPTGLSRLDLLFADVAKAVVVEAAERSGSNDSRLRRMPALALVSAVVILLSAFGAWLTSGRGSSSSDIDNPAGPVAARVCESPGDASDFVRASPSVSAEIRTLANNQPVELCSDGELLRWGDLYLQPVSNKGRIWGAVIAADSGGGSVLIGSHWYSYSSVGQVEVPERIGLPVGELRPLGEGWSLETSGPDLLVGSTEDGLFFWLPQGVATAWIQDGAWGGELGGPVSNPYAIDAGIRIDFQNGYALLRDLDGEARMVIEGAPRLSDSNLVAFKGGLVTTVGGTRWLIDSEGHRWWAPDRRLWDCAGGDSNLAASDLADASISRLPFGGLLTCPVEVPGGARGGGLDLALYCYDRWSPAHVAVVAGSTWVCANGESVEPIDVDAACQWQYGRQAISFSEPENVYSWRCRSS